MENSTTSGLSGAPVEPGSPKDPGGPGDPVQPPHPQVVPSSTPSGPSTIPAPSTPEGEPGPDPEDAADTEVVDSNPNSGGTQRLAGDMGVSSERRGADLPRDTVQGTGSRGSATTETDGTGYTTGDGPEMDDTQQQATQDWRDEQPAARESNTAEVPAHASDPRRNPGHSHG